MPSYRRAYQPGGTSFFTLVTEGRAPLFASEQNRALLHDAIAAAARDRHFTIDGLVLLPDHAHAQLTLPPNDADFSVRLAAIKARFTRAYLNAGGLEQPRFGTRIAKRRRGVWQRWFWEHTIRDADDRVAHLNYIHYNAVKHGLARCPHGYPYSTIHRHVALGNYEPDWCCACQGSGDVPDFNNLPVAHMEFGE
jgi:putative transposase